MAAGWPDGTPLRRGLTFTYNHAQALQFLRTTYKAGPLVALGLAVLGGGALSAAVARIPRLPRSAALVGASAALVAVAAWPLVTGNALDRQLEFKLPAAWHQLAADLGHRPDSSRALVEPGQLFAFQRWGGTIDNVLPALTDHPVATRYIVPFADLRSADVQWGVDDLIGQERALPGQLRPLLDLMAVGDVVVSSDNDRRRGGGQNVLETNAVLAPLLDQPGKDYGTPRRVQPAAGRIAAPAGGAAAARHAARNPGDRARAPARAGDDRRRLGGGARGARVVRRPSRRPAAALRGRHVAGGAAVRRRARRHDRDQRLQPPPGVRRRAPAAEPRRGAAGRPGHLRRRHLPGSVRPRKRRADGGGAARRGADLVAVLAADQPVPRAPAVRRRRRRPEHRMARRPLPCAAAPPSGHHVPGAARRAVHRPAALLRRRAGSRGS